METGMETVKHAALNGKVWHTRGGFHIFKVGPDYFAIQREALVREGGAGRSWEVVWWDREDSSWIASHPKAPAGFFGTMRLAADALEEHIK